MIIVGINAYHGDAAAALVIDGKLGHAIEEERLNRIKHSAGLPKSAVQSCLEKAGISLKEVDYVSVSRNPTANFIPKLQFLLRNRPSLSFLKGRLGVAHESASWNGTKTERVEHHLSHAASAFYPSGFESAALLTVDGFGDFSSVMFGKGEGNRIKVLNRILFPHSLGVVYTAATQYLGFLKYGDEYKVMGLASYGEPRFLKEFRKLILLEAEGPFKLNLNYFAHPQGAEMTWKEGEPVLGLAYTQKWQELFGPPRHPEETLTQRDKDLAASVQAIFEETFFHLLLHLYKKTRIKSLCLAGGCAFNSVANGKIFDNSPFEKVYIQAAAGDAGTALGSALYIAHHKLNQPRNFVMDHAYWGPEFGEKEIEEALNDKRKALSERNCKVEKITAESELCQKTAKAIADGKVVGWFQGRMEWGPRALGNRSILADPRRQDMKDILNERIKCREGFRPFAPSVLKEKADEWFEMKTTDSPFMNLVFRVRSGKRNQIPAVTHVDGTARLHTISKNINPLFWQVIHEFDRLTGIPLVLNTSFNENEPIVCTPAEALHCFLRTRMDVLALGPYWIEC